MGARRTWRGGFGGAVGGCTALTSVTTDAPGSTALNGGIVTTTGAQTYNDAVTLGANTTATSTGSGNVTLPPDEATTMPAISGPSINAAGAWIHSRKAAMAADRAISTTHWTAAASLL